TLIRFGRPAAASSANEGPSVTALEPALRSALRAHLEPGSHQHQAPLERAGFEPWSRPGFMAAKPAPARSLRPRTQRGYADSKLKSHCDRRLAIKPRPRLLELRGQSKKHRLVAVARDELNRDREFSRGALRRGV